MPIKVRLGVNTGEALVRLDVDPRSGEGFVLGDTLNTAARLETAAPIMSVAVGERTYRASASAIDFEQLDPIVAKGKVDEAARSPPGSRATTTRVDAHERSSERAAVARRPSPDQPSGVQASRGRASTRRGT